MTSLALAAALSQSCVSREDLAAFKAALVADIVATADS